MHPFSLVLLGAWLCIQFSAALRARYSNPLSSTRRWITKSFLGPLRAGLQSNEYSNFEENAGSESPLSEGSSEVKYDRGRRASPLPVDIIGFLPVPMHAPTMSTSTSESDHPPDATKVKRRGARRGSTTDFIARAVKIHGDKYDYSLTEYGKNNSDKVTIICPRHDPPIEFRQSPSDHLNGKGCRPCSIVRRGLLLSGNTEDFIAKAVAKHGDLYDYSLTEYVSATKDKVTIICKSHNPPHAFRQAPNNHLSGKGCQRCAAENKPGWQPRSTTGQFIEKAIAKHGNLYDYSLARYGRSNIVKVTIICPRHDPPIEFSQRPNNHLLGSGCPECGRIRGGDKRRANTTEFVAQAVKIHGDQYNYSLTEYGKTNRDKVTIICTRHDPPLSFEQSPSEHLVGKGCTVCANSRKGQTVKASTEDFVAQAVKIHGDQYDYSLTEYVGAMKDKVTIICTRHDAPIAFEQLPNDHLEGKGCRACAIAQKSQKKGDTAGFIAQAVKIHGDQYDYSLSDCGKRSTDKVTIICTRHDPPLAFELSPSKHLRGAGCRECTIVKKESEAAIE
jgi:hypothetical protein